MDSSHPGDGPTRIGDFEIVRELGRGGMGVVYEARERSLNRLVALKVLSTGLGLTTKAVMRFKREAEAAAKLHHTNIVPIYSTGDEGRVPYYAMELIDGPSLDQVIRQMRSGPGAAAKGPLETTDDTSGDEQDAAPGWVAATIGFKAPTTEGSASVSSSTSVTGSSLGANHQFYDNLAGMLADVADALAHAHDQGVVHRDIKPSNLLLSQDGRLSINDFGLARMLEQPGMTMTGEFMGSPAYMSPEQVTAGRIPLDHRTDIYSLGAALYELLTLQPPFTGQQRDQVLSQIIHKEPPRPRTINKQIPKDLETICLKALEKDPDRRYQTADQMAKDLRSFVNRHAISARRIGAVERGMRWARKNKAISAMACVTLIVGVAAAAFVYSSWQEKEQLLREKAMEDALTAAMSGRLEVALTDIQRAGAHGADPVWGSILRSQVHLFEGDANDAIEELEIAVASPGGRFHVTAKAMLATAYGSNGQWGKYLDELEALKLLPELEPDDPFKAVEESTKGMSLTTQSPDEALTLINRAIARRPDFHLARVMRANVRAFQAMDQEGGDVDLVREALEEDIDTASTFLSETPVLRATRLYARLVAAHLHRRRGEDTLAEDQLKKAADDVDFLNGFPKYAFGNFDRLYYYDLVYADDPEAALEHMRPVMQAVIDHGHRGYISDPYWAACYRLGRFEEALDSLDRLPKDDGYNSWRRVIFQLEAASGQTDRQQRFQEIISDYARQKADNLWAGETLLLLGRRDDAVERARRFLDAIDAAGNRDLGYRRDEIEFAAGDIDRDELLRRAQGSERNLLEGRFSIGLNWLSLGERAEARQSFQDAANGTLYHWTTFVWSREFAARMKRDPEWPPWIPKPDGASERD